MKKNLLIIFVKNAKLGKVKTRLAKTIGNEKALAIYHQLLEITEKATHEIVMDQRVYYSEEIEEKGWEGREKRIQEGGDLGARMKNAFEKGFNDGYTRIVLVGSDLPDLSKEIIENGFESLRDNEIVFGPAEDGGYYLVGMRNKEFSIFENKPWSTKGLLKKTTNELAESNTNYGLLKMLNDVDTYEDLKRTSLH